MLAGGGRRDVYNIVSTYVTSFRFFYNELSFLSCMYDFSFLVRVLLVQAVLEKALLGREKKTVTY